MRYGVAIMALTLLASAGTAFAQISVPPALPANPVPGVAAPTTAPDAPITDETIVCKYEHDTGTLMMVQVCRTQRAWKQMQSDAQEYMEFGFRGSHQTDEGGSGS